MPTIEERLTTLERNFATFQKDNNTAYMRKTDENLTILLSIVQDHGLDIKRIFKRLETIDQRLESVDHHLETMDQRFDQIETKFDQRFDVVDQRFVAMETKFDQHTALLTQILERLPAK